MCLPEILLSNIRLLPDNPKLSPAFPPSTARLHPPPGAFPYTGPASPASRDGVSVTPKSGGLFRRRGRERACSSVFQAATPKSSLVFLRRGPSCAPFATFIKVRKAQNDPICAFGGQSQRVQRAESVSSGGESEFQKGRASFSEGESQCFRDTKWTPSFPGPFCGRKWQFSVRFRATEWVWRD